MHVVGLLYALNQSVGQLLGLMVRIGLLELDQLFTVLPHEPCDQPFGLCLHVGILLPLSHGRTEHAPRVSQDLVDMGVRRFELGEELLRQRLHIVPCNRLTALRDRVDNLTGNGRCEITGNECTVQQLERIVLVQGENGREIRPETV